MNISSSVNIPGTIAPYASPSAEEQLGRADTSAPTETVQAVPPANEVQARQPQQDEPERSRDGDERVGGRIDAYA